jgi:acetyltransferase
MPKSVAIIGASGTEGKVGFSVLKNIISSGYKGEIYPINKKKEILQGLKCFKSILDIENSIDTAIVCIPARFVVQIVKDCVKKKVNGIVIISAGFKEIGGEGAIYEQEIHKIAEENNVRIVGPNCLGIIAPTFNASFANRHPKKGNIAMISQSGAMLTSILDWAELHDIGFSNCISMGNKVDLDEVDFIEELAEDPETKIILAYLESVNNGKKFMEIIPKVTLKKPVILLKAGSSEAGSRAASSHTGALAGNKIAFSLAFEKSGVIVANSMTELFNIARIFNQAPIPKGNNFAIVTNAGGPGIVATDAFENHNLGLSKFSNETIKHLRTALPDEAAVYNPVDIIGDAPPERYRTALEIIFKESDSSCAGAIVAISPQALTEPEKVAEILIEMQKKYPNKLIVGVFMGGISMISPNKILMNSTIPVYEFPEAAVKATKYMCEYAENQRKPDINAKKIPKFRIATERISEIFSNAREDGRTTLLASETSEIFRIYGIKNPKTLLAKTLNEVKEKSMKIGFPLVMKVVSPDIVHKSDVGGVILNIGDEEAAVNSFIQILNSIKKFGPSNARVYGVEIQEMIKTKDKSKKTELIIGMSRDYLWGPLLMVGTGGIYANYFKDVSFDLAYKYDRDDALKQLSRTNVYSLLQGVRGEPPSDIEAVLDVMVRLSQLVHDCEDIVELDINPLLVFEETQEHDAYSAVDIKITIKKQN